VEREDRVGLPRHVDDRRDRAPNDEWEEHTMSDDERNRKRKEHDDAEPDVEAHSYTIDDPTNDDPEKKRKRKEHEDEDEFGRKRK
jgi:hypothetical protein